MNRLVFRSLVLPVLAVALLLSGCATVDAGSQLTARGLQAQVLEVSQAAAEGDHAGALLRLQELEALANEALARKTITDETHASILSAMALVRQDLELAIQAEQEPEPAAPPATPAGNGDGDNDDDDDHPGKGNGRGKND